MFRIHNREELNRLALISKEINSKFNLKFPIDLLSAPDKLIAIEHGTGREGHCVYTSSGRLRYRDILTTDEKEAIKSAEAVGYDMLS